MRLKNRRRLIESGQTSACAGNSSCISSRKASESASSSRVRNSACRRAVEALLDRLELRPEVFPVVHRWHTEQLVSVWESLILYS